MVTIVLMMMMTICGDNDYDDHTDHKMMTIILIMTMTIYGDHDNDDHTDHKMKTIILIMMIYGDNDNDDDPGEREARAQRISERRAEQVSTLQELGQSHHDHN